MSQAEIRNPRGIIYEPGERVLAVGRPFAWWVALLLLALVLAVVAAVAATQTMTAVAVSALGATLIVLVLTLVRFIEWTSRVWVLTDRRVIARSGILNRTQAAFLLERVTEGLQEIAITRASRFYAQLTDALTPGR
ncbi:MAG TPA: PH domain-containing protein [Candidatus Limnocylindria bacterium]|jgi:uncharacterized membrane protein YdbT with pleckstrin-like domain